MPQMAPLMWLYLYFYFLLALVMILTINHFIKPYNKMSTLPTLPTLVKTSWKL